MNLRSISHVAVTLLLFSQSTIAISQFSGGSTEKATESAASRSAADLEKGCDAGNAFDCSDLAIRHVNGNGVEKSDKKATALFLRACDGGDAVGCERLALAHRSGWGVKADPAKAALFADRACKGENAYGCLLLGETYAAGSGGYPKDLRRAETLFRQACFAKVNFAQRPDRTSQLACPQVERLSGKAACQARTEPSGAAANYCYREVVVAEGAAAPERRALWLRRVVAPAAAPVLRAPVQTAGRMPNAGLLGSAVKQVDGIAVDDFDAIKQLAAQMFDAKVPEAVRTSNIAKLRRLAEAGSDQAAAFLGSMLSLSKQDLPALKYFKQCVSGVDDVTVLYEMKSHCYLSIGLIEMRESNPQASKVRALAALDECAKRGNQSCIATARGLRAK